MNYTGKLYGKFGKTYFPLILTSEDVDRMERELAEAREQRDKLAACIIHLKERDWINDDSIHSQVVCGLDADTVREALSTLTP
jgi:hypothetical protein